MHETLQINAGDGVATPGGCVTHAEIKAAYNKALLESRHEEHGI